MRILGSMFHHMLVAPMFPISQRTQRQSSRSRVWVLCLVEVEKTGGHRRVTEKEVEGTSKNSVKKLRQRIENVSPREMQLVGPFIFK